MSTIQEITEAIERLDMKDQVILVEDLPRHLKFSLDDIALPRLAESAFDFWNNPEDAIYDTL